MNRRFTMPKRKKNPAKQTADFTKRKNKVGKKAAPSASETKAKVCIRCPNVLPTKAPPRGSTLNEIQVSARKVYVPSQLDGAQGDTRTNPSLKQGARLVPLTDILARCGHTSAKVRADAVSLLKQLELQERHKESDSRSAWIGRAIERLVTMLEDSGKRRPYLLTSA